ncbi:uncharacterized protein [Lolium perenne]|uniref:uncharacterized protein n=1 Tax=Lolium perenne TaxID=4522 RepID=UPI003A9A0FBA
MAACGTYIRPDPLVSLMGLVLDGSHVSVGIGSVDVVGSQSPLTSSSPIPSLSSPSTSWSNSRRPISSSSRSRPCRRRREKPGGRSHHHIQSCTSFSTKWKEGYGGSKVREGPLRRSPLSISSGLPPPWAQQAQQEEYHIPPPPVVRSAKERLEAGREQRRLPLALLPWAAGELLLCCTSPMRCARLLYMRTPASSTTTCPFPPLLPRRPTAGGWLDQRTAEGLVGGRRKQRKPPLAPPQCVFPLLQGAAGEICPCYTSPVHRAAVPGLLRHFIVFEGADQQYNMLSSTSSYSIGRRTILPHAHLRWHGARTTAATPREQHILPPLMVRSLKEWLVAGGEQRRPPRALPSLKGAVGEIRPCCTSPMRCAGVPGFLRTRTPASSTTTCPSPPFLPRRPAAGG